MAAEIDKLDNKVLLNAYDAILAGKEESLLADLNKKEAEKKLKEEYAQKKQYFKKDGKTLDLGKVKMPTMIKAMEINAGGQNKLEAEIAVLEQYIIDLKQDRGIGDRAKSLQSKIMVAKDSKGASKDITAEFKTQLDSEIVDAIDYLTGLEIAAKKENLEGGDGKKPKKGNDQLLNLVKELKKKLGK